MMGLRTNHCPPIFTRLVSHATRFAILGSPVLPTTVNTGKTSQLCLVGQTVVQYFVKPVDCVAGGEGGRSNPPEIVKQRIYNRPDSIPKSMKNQQRICQ